MDDNVEKSARVVDAAMPTDEIKGKPMDISNVQEKQIDPRSQAIPLGEYHKRKTEKGRFRAAALALLTGIGSVFGLKTGEEVGKVIVPPAAGALAAAKDRLQAGGVTPEAPAQEQAKQIILDSQSRNATEVKKAAEVGIEPPSKLQDLNQKP